MLVFAFSLLIIIPLVSLMNSEYQKNKAELDLAQSDEILNEIAATATDMYHAGYPSRETLEFMFPRGISQIQSQTVITAEGPVSELVFIFDRSGVRNSLIRTFHFEINTSLESRDGKRFIVVKAEEGNYVNITEDFR